jgi:hypothetical protein
MISFYLCIYIYIPVLYDTVGAKSLERREKFRAQIQPHLLSSTIKIESCTLEKVQRAACWWGG